MSYVLNNSAVENLNDKHKEKVENQRAGISYFL